MKRVRKESGMSGLCRAELGGAMGAWEFETPCCEDNCWGEAEESDTAGRDIGKHCASFREF